MSINHTPVVARFHSCSRTSQQKSSGGHRARCLVTFSWNPCIVPICMLARMNVHMTMSPIAAPSTLGRGSAFGPAQRRWHSQHFGSARTGTRMRHRHKNTTVALAVDSPVLQRWHWPSTACRVTLVSAIATNCVHLWTGDLVSGHPDKERKGAANHKQK